MSPHVKQALSELAARVLDVTPEQVSRTPFDELGLGLTAAVALTEEINSRFGTTLPTDEVTGAADRVGDLDRLDRKSVV